MNEPSTKFAQRVASRRAAVAATTISYPPELPVSQRKDDIAAAIRDHQVVIIAGKTGSGKTTQIPKICLELGRGVDGQIGHTQPRRLAARTVAERIAEELGSPVGETVALLCVALGLPADTCIKQGDTWLVKRPPTPYQAFRETRDAEAERPPATAVSSP